MPFVELCSIRLLVEAGRIVRPRVDQAAQLSIESYAWHVLAYGIEF